MDAVHETPQRIARLTPLADVLAAVDGLVRPVEPCRVEIEAAIGFALAADLAAADPQPRHAIALRDGWALASNETQDAGSYAPAMLARPPAYVQAGDALPGGADAVAETDAVRQRANGWEALVSLAPAEGLLAPGADVAAGEILLRAGARLRATDIAVLRALEIDRVSVRKPRVRIATARAHHILDAAARALAGLAAADGAAADVEPSAAELDAVLTGRNADFIVIIGGTGTGVRDRSVATLSRLGHVTCHGVALSPGETAALGHMADTPVLLVPGRIDAAVATWLAIGRHMLTRLAVRNDSEPTLPCTLARKLVSGLGMSELVLLRRDGDTVAPIASGYLPLSALAQAGGYVLVPPDSEGYPAGARVDMKVLR